MKRSRSYYVVRSAVRWVFWSSVAGSVMIGAGAIGDWIDKSDENLCPVELNADFTWAPAGDSRVDIDSCRHPVGKVLLSDGRWDWDWSSLDG